GSQDIDAFAEDLIKGAKIAEKQANNFRQALQFEACENLRDRLLEAFTKLKQAELAGPREESLVEQITVACNRQTDAKTGASLAAFRQDLGDMGSEIVNAVAADLPDRAAFIERILETFVTSEDAKALLVAGFDEEGWVRIFEDWGRFRDVYTPGRAMAASRQLLS